MGWLKYRYVNPDPKTRRFQELNGILVMRYALGRTDTVSQQWNTVRIGPFSSTQFFAMRSRKTPKGGVSDDLKKINHES
jgi:hypothetical protein